MTKKKIFIIAGEASGDLQASKLIRAIKKQSSEIEFHGIGGDKMILENLILIKHMKELSFIGFIEVIKHLPEIFKNILLVKAELIKVNPNLIILIDFPGFNLKIAKIAKKLDIPVVYYITPQLWAWHESRVKLMKRYVDLIINVFPFETDFYLKYGIKSYYFGHPLTEDLTTKYPNKKSFCNTHKINENDLIVSILPGSRKTEVENLLQTMIDGVQLWGNSKVNLQIIISKVSHLDQSLYNFTNKKNYQNIRLVENNSYDLMAFSDMLIIASGTATLESAIFQTPMIVCYKVNSITFAIAKRLVKIPFISLVNIVSKKKIVPELIQENFTIESLANECEKVYQDRKKIKDELKMVSESLQSKDVSLQVADCILKYLENK